MTTLVLEDRVIESTTTTGTGSLTLAGPLTGFRAFSSVMVVGDTCKYALWEVDGSGAASGGWEVGTGTYTGSNTLSRDIVSESSNSNSLVNFAAGTKYVSISLLSEDLMTVGKASAIAAAVCTV